MRIVTTLDIKNHGMCKWNNKIQCSVFCAAFIIDQCSGMRLIIVEIDRWIDQDINPFPKYAEEHKKGVDENSH